MTGVFLDDVELPSIDIDLSVESSKDDGVQEEQEVSFSTIPKIGENQILAEGAERFKDHPDLKPLLDQLHELQDEFIKKVQGCSEGFELSGFVKVLFAVDKK